MSPKSISAAKNASKEYENTDPAFDEVIAQQAIMCAKKHSGATVVVADDTDKFILLLFHYLNERRTCPMFMISPIQHDHLSTLRKFIGACYGNRIGEKRRSPISDTRSGQRSLKLQQPQSQDTSTAAYYRSF